MLWPVDLLFKSEDEFIFDQAPGKNNTLKDLKAGLETLDDMRFFSCYNPFGTKASWMAGMDIDWPLWIRSTQSGEK